MPAASELPSRTRWMHSPALDLGLFSLPVVFMLWATLQFPGYFTYRTLWVWLFFFGAINDGHVFCTLYLTYLDSGEFARRKTLLIAVPTLVFLSSLLVWRLWGPRVLMALWNHFAVFHFVRQQYGFSKLYRHLGKEPPGPESILDDVTIYSAAFAPLVYLQATESLRHQWMLPDILLRLPAAWALPAQILFWGSLAAFVGRQAYLLISRESVNWGKVAVTLTTAAAWYYGLAVVPGSILITVNVQHGIGYFGLTWLYLRRSWKGAGAWQKALIRPSSLLFFVGMPMILGCLQVVLGTIVLGHRNPLRLSMLNSLAHLSYPAQALGGAIMVTIAVSHYIIDGFIWRVDPAKSDVKRYLLGDGALLAPGGAQGRG